MHGTAPPSGGSLRAVDATLLSTARGNGYSVATYFAAFIAVLLVAVVAAIGWLEYRWAASERVRLEQSAIQKARDITAEIDSTMVARENLLAVLAGSYSLLSSDVETFYRQAAEVGRQLDVMFSLREPATGTRIFNTNFPWGSRLPPGNAVLEGDREQALRSGKPAVSDVFLATNVKRYLVAVTVPVMRDRAQLYFLTMALDAHKFLSIFDRLQIGDNQIAMIVDRRGAVVARSDRNDEFVGRELHAEFLARESPAEGVAEAFNLEGIPIKYFYDRSASTGWRVVVGVPRSLLQAPGERALGGVAITFGLLLSIGGAIAYAIGQRISSSIRALRSAAIALGHHEQVAAPLTSLRETNELADAISAASTEMRDDLRLRLLRAQDQERLRLAHELHDQTGQSLTAIMMELKSLEAEIEPGARDRLRGLRKQLDRMGHSLHRVAWELRPASINELGLTAALTNYVSEWSAQSGIEVDFHSSDSSLDAHSEEVRTTLYRVVQEALTNIAKHAAGASAASVTISRTDSMLRLTIEDNGSGFDTTTLGLPGARAFGGLGLASMRERLSLIRGKLEIESSLGVGTTIFVRVQLQPHRAVT
jgi:signal transduction histidine kinase